MFGAKATKEEDEEQSTKFMSIAKVTYAKVALKVHVATSIINIEQQNKTDKTHQHEKRSRTTQAQ